MKITIKEIQEMAKKHGNEYSEQEIEDFYRGKEFVSLLDLDKFVKGVKENV